MWDQLEINACSEMISPNLIYNINSRDDDKEQNIHKVCKHANWHRRTHTTSRYNVRAPVCSFARFHKSVFVLLMRGNNRILFFPFKFHYRNSAIFPLNPARHMNTIAHITLGDAIVVGRDEIEAIVLPTSSVKWHDYVFFILFFAFRVHAYWMRCV